MSVRSSVMSVRSFTVLYSPQTQFVPVSGLLHDFTCETNIPLKGDCKVHYELVRVMLCYILVSILINGNMFKDLQLHVFLMDL